MTNYERYRGKCKELAEALVKENPTLVLVRGFYICPIWGRKEQHWWAKDRFAGAIHDPTAAQFPSNGMGEYLEFDGICTCDECGKQFPEDSEFAIFRGRFALCSSRCFGRFVGITV